MPSADLERCDVRRPRRGPILRAQEVGMVTRIDPTQVQDVDMGTNSTADTALKTCKQASNGPQSQRPGTSISIRTDVPAGDASRHLLDGQQTMARQRA
ncbi:hypothetical protein A4X06_0g1727 [Tilletia controversa]|uniref:Uncharacterized protein n=1 Tax=Tilletia controversa TaxID=13291 RepID=A0A8X7SZ25_9BASI|nr:hypothetical protein CF328_g8117 [Tilletia controversa]KAE8253060.1 hypothetical protein A4X06_0g1727 [Tilletia controversa]